MIDRVDELFDAHCREVGGPFWAELPHIEQQRLMLMAEASYRSLDKGEVVKPLEWDRDRFPGYSQASSTIGTYRAYADGTVTLDTKQVSYEAGRIIYETEVAAQADYASRVTSALLPKATAPVVSEPVTEGMKAEALRLLKAYDEREDKVQEIIEDLREIVLLMPAASRPDGLMKQAQAAVYAMRGRTRLMDDVAITAPLSAETQPITVTDSMVERAWTAYDAKSGYSKPERFRAALEAAMKEA